LVVAVLPFGSKSCRCTCFEFCSWSEFYPCHRKGICRKSRGVYSFECFIYLGRKIKIFSTSANHSTCSEQCLRGMMLPWFFCGNLIYFSRLTIDNLPAAKTHMFW
jgi:hypothetical protein